jgi:hypothetical protein
MIWKCLALHLLLVWTVSRTDAANLSENPNDPTAKHAHHPEPNTLSLQVNSQSGAEPGHSPAVHPQHEIGVSPGHPVTGEATSQQDDTESRRAEFINHEDVVFIIIMAVVVVTGFVGILLAGVCYFRLRKSAKATSEVAYPAYRVTGQIKERGPSAGDRKLAQSAQMFHYQHQKQQMIAMEKANVYMKHDASEDDTDDPGMDGDYTVFECPGLAPTGEMEVKNPFFRGMDPPAPPASSALEPTEHSKSQGTEPQHEK